MTPRRYRAALLLLPGDFRRSREDEILGTLADGDEARGRPSTREALALVRLALAMRADPLALAALLLLVAASLSSFDWWAFSMAGDPSQTATTTYAPGMLFRVGLVAIALLALLHRPVLAPVVSMVVPMLLIYRYQAETADALAPDARLVLAGIPLAGVVLLLQPHRPPLRFAAALAAFAAAASLVRALMATEPLMASDVDHLVLGPAVPIVAVALVLALAALLPFARHRDVVRRVSG